MPMPVHGDRFGVMNPIQGGYEPTALAALNDSRTMSREIHR